MSEQGQAQIDWEAIRQKAGPYPLEAYHFVREGLSYTASLVFGESEGLEEIDRHVSGQELCLGLKSYAVDQWGMMAPIVLECWSIRSSIDFGRIVFAMIDGGLMSRRADDCIEDFEGVFDFREVFSHQELAAHIGECNAP
ncbi:MAG: hypothetical protein MK089_13490 [Phycisphaerales bacterium]|nr:hypothetical protein [Phycisphaerales bacterium]